MRFADLRPILRRRPARASSAHRALSARRVDRRGVGHHAHQPRRGRPPLRDRRVRLDGEQPAHPPPRQDGDVRRRADAQHRSPRSHRGRRGGGGAPGPADPPRRAAGPRHRQGILWRQESRRHRGRHHVRHDGDPRSQAVHRAIPPRGRARCAGGGDRRQGAARAVRQVESRCGETIRIGEWRLQGDRGHRFARHVGRDGRGRDHRHPGRRRASACSTARVSFACSAR